MPGRRCCWCSRIIAQTAGRQKKVFTGTVLTTAVDMEEIDELFMEDAKASAKLVLAANEGYMTI